MTIRTGIAALTLGLSFIGPAQAQVVDTLRADTSVIRLGGISVQAARPVTTIGGTSAIEVIVDSLSLGFAPRFEQVLRALPMIHVRTNSRGEAELTLRGSESRQVAILLDGVPLTLQWDARTDVSVVPATAVQELTFTRGLSSMLYGPNVLGGVVEVSVAHGRLQPASSSVSIGGGFDQVGAYGSTATVTVPATSAAGHWLMRAGLGYRDSPGVPLARGVVEPVPAGDGSLRLNTDTNQRDGFFAMRYEADKGPWFALSGSGFSAERGIAAELGSDSPRLWRYPSISRFITVASAGTGDRQSPFGGRGDIEASIGVDVGKSDINSYSTRAYDEVVGFENGEDRTITARLLADHTLREGADLRAAFTFADIFHREILPEATSEYQQRFWSLGGETIIQLFRGSGATVRLSAGGAIDMSSTPMTGDKPSLDGLTDWGARIGLSAALRDGTVLLHAGGSRRGRFPALRELYSGALNRFEPNPGLAPEHLIALEGGVTTRLADTELQAVLFHHRLSDAIGRIRTPANKFQRINRDEMRSTGLELLASRSFGHFSVGGDLILQTVDLIDPTAGETTEPENQPAVFGSLNAGFPIVLGFRARADIGYTGSQHCLDLSTGDDTQLDGGSHINADVSRVFAFRPTGSMLSKLEARIAVDNIGDTALYDQCGLPQAGRVVRFEIRLF